MKLSMGGLAPGVRAFETSGGGLSHSSVMEERSTIPITLDAGNEEDIKEGA